VLQDAAEWPSLPSFQADAAGWNLVDGGLPRQVSSASSVATLTSSWTAPSEASEASADSWVEVQVKPRGRRPASEPEGEHREDEHGRSYAELVRLNASDAELQRPPESGCRRRPPPPTRRRHNKLQGVLREEAAPSGHVGAADSDDDDDGFAFVGDCRVRHFNKGQKASHSVKSKLKVQCQTEKRAVQAAASRGGTL